VRVSSSPSIAVIGGGAWGTALAVHAARLNHRVGLWVREPEVVAGIRASRENSDYLPGIRIPDAVEASSRLEQVLDGRGLVIAVVPSSFARDVYTRMAPLLSNAVPVAVAAKGIEEGSLALPLDVADEILGGRERLAVISGPSFAQELARGKPTAIVAASHAPDLAASLQASLSSDVLRLYTSADVTGVQIAGALKNVIAIAAGVADSLGMGLNAQSALITRGLAEICRLGLALGGLPSTFSGLAGLGDLVLTCTGPLSRNREVGRRLGGGESLEQILAGAKSVAEGIRTTRSARELGGRHSVDLPIVEELHRVMFDGGSAELALGRLMARPLRSEDAPAQESRP